MAHILIMEDDLDQAKTWRNVLRVEGHEVVLTTGAQAAMTHLTDARFDLAIVDMFIKRGDRYLPDGGVRLISWLRGPRLKVDMQENGARALMDIPILAISGGAYVRGGHDPLRLARDQGADMWLRKPVEREEFLAAVNRLLLDEDI